MRKQWLKKPFNSDGPFVACRYFRFNGIQYSPGRVLDATGVSTRRLRQMYDGRKIDIVEPTQEIEREEVYTPPPPKTHVGPSTPLPEDVQAILNAYAVEPSDDDILKEAFEKTGTRYRSVERAKAALEKLNNGTTHG